MLDKLYLLSFGLGWIVLTIPQRYLFHVIGWLLIPVVFVLIYFLHPVHWSAKGIDFVLGWMMLIVAYAGVILAVFAKLIFILLQWKFFPEKVARRKKASSNPLYQTLRKLQAVIWGIIFSFLAILILRYLLQPIPNFLTHAFFLAVVIFVFWAPHKIDVPFADFGKALLLGFQWGFLILVVLGVLMSNFVSMQAEKITIPSNKYCIQIADSDQSYKPVTTLFDLSYLTMRHSGSRLQYHALLVVDEGNEYKFYNWSYRKGEFQDDAFKFFSGPYGAAHKPEILCSPTENFTNELNIIFP